jgi:hypothetical protein
MTQKFALFRRLLQMPVHIIPSPGIDSPEIAIYGKADRNARVRQVLYWTFVALAIALLFSLQPVLASDAIWAKFSEVMKDIYGRLLGISTIIAVTAATIALLVRMISRNQRAVDEATTWLKRIVVTWIILNTLGFIIAYLQPWFTGGQYTP